MAFKQNCYTLLNNIITSESIDAKIFYENLPENYDLNNDDYIVYTYKKDEQVDMLGQKNLYSLYTLEITTISLNDIIGSDLSEILREYLINISNDYFQQINFIDCQSDIDVQSGVYTYTSQYQIMYVEADGELVFSEVLPTTKYRLDIHETSIGYLTSIVNKLDASINFVGNVSTNLTLNCSTYSFASFTLNSSIGVTLTPLATNTFRSVYIEVTQDASGLKYVNSWTNCKFPGGVLPILSTNANAKDLLSFIFDGSSYVLTNISYNIS